jgi:putative MATE family efflux protein
MNLEKSIKMRNQPVGKLIASMSIPAMFSMLIQALYNIVDTVYVAQIDTTSDRPITALGYAFPMQMLIMAFALGVGIGTNVLVSRKLGEKKPDEASGFARTGVMLSLIIAAIFFILSTFIVRPFMEMMSNNQEIIDYGTAYLRICMMFSVFLIMEILYNKILQSTGQMIVPMISQLIGALTNIILDPIFIFGWLGLKPMGVRGAAIATVIAQGAAFLFTYIYTATRKLEISLSFKHFKPSLANVTGIVKVGLPSTVMNAVASITNVSLNSILRYFDPEETANAVLTVYFKLQSFVFMPAFGLNQGGMPILSYNYGARNKERFQKAFRILITTAVIMLLIGLIIFQTLPSTLLGFFSPSAKMIEIGIPALRIISLAFLPAALSIILTMTFQAVGHGFKALIMSLMRQLLLILPLSFLLGLLWHLNGVWLAFVFAELLVAAVFFPIGIRLIRRIFLEQPLIS